MIITLTGGRATSMAPPRSARWRDQLGCPEPHAQPARWLAASARTHAVMIAGIPSSRTIAWLVHLVRLAIDVPSAGLVGWLLRLALLAVGGAAWWMLA